MIRFLILTVGCLITLPTIGQSTFFKRYDLIKGSTAGFQSVFRTPNGYIASSIVSDTSGNEYLGYLGISESGNIRFNKLDTFLSSSPKFGKSIKLHDGNFISLFTGQWFDSSSYLNTISY